MDLVPGGRRAGGRERQVFLDSTQERMRTFVKLALERAGDATEPLRDAAAAMIARPNGDGEAHARLADQLRDARVAVHSGSCVACG